MAVEGICRYAVQPCCRAHLLARYDVVAFQPAVLRHIGGLAALARFCVPALARSRHHWRHEAFATHFRDAHKLGGGRVEGDLSERGDIRLDAHVRLERAGVKQQQRRGQRAGLVGARGQQSPVGRARQQHLRETVRSQPRQIGEPRKHNFSNATASNEGWTHTLEFGKEVERYFIGR